MLARRRRGCRANCLHVERCLLNGSGGAAGMWMELCSEGRGDVLIRRYIFRRTNWKTLRRQPSPSVERSMNLPRMRKKSDASFGSTLAGWIFSSSSSVRSSVSTLSGRLPISARRGSRGSSSSASLSSCPTDFSRRSSAPLFRRKADPTSGPGRLLGSL